MGREVWLVPRNGLSITHPYMCCLHDLQTTGYLCTGNLAFFVYNNNYKTGVDPGFLGRGFICIFALFLTFICIKVWGFALQILSHIQISYENEIIWSHKLFRFHRIFKNWGWEGGGGGGGSSKPPEPPMDPPLQNYNDNSSTPSTQKRILMVLAALNPF